MQLNFLENRLKIGRRPKVGSFIYSIEFCWKMSLKSAEGVFFVFNVYFMRKSNKLTILMNIISKLNKIKVF